MGVITIVHADQYIMVWLLSRVSCQKGRIPSLCSFTFKYKIIWVCGMREIIVKSYINFIAERGFTYASTKHMEYVLLFWAMGPPSHVFIYNQSLQINYLTLSVMCIWEIIGESCLSFMAARGLIHFILVFTPNVCDIFVVLRNETPKACVHLK